MKRIKKTLKLTFLRNEIKGKSRIKYICACQNKHLKNLEYFFFVYG